MARKGRVRAWVMGEFTTAKGMLEAARALKSAGHPDIDTYSPYLIEGNSEALGLPRSRVPYFVLGGGLSGATLGYLMQWYLNAVNFPINVGGRPLHSVPAFIPITFELAVLLGSLGAFLGLLGLLGLPEPYHPVFEADGFDRASVDRFWISVAWSDAAAWDGLASELEKLGARVVVVKGKS